MLCLLACTKTVDHPAEELDFTESGSERQRFSYLIPNPLLKKATANNFTY